MASFKYKINTQVGHPLVGTISVDILPDPIIANGHYSFGVIAPNGIELKTISPVFIDNPSLGTERDYLATSSIIGNVFLVNIPLDSNGDYMTGKYTFKVFYKEYKTDFTVETYDETVTFVVCNPKTWQYKGVLTAKFNQIANIVLIEDKTDYTGLTVVYHDINSVRISDNYAFSTVAYSQSLAVASYVSTLKAWATKLYTTSMPNTAIEQIFSITAKINSPTDLSNYSQVLEKAFAFIRQMKGELCKKLKLSAANDTKFHMVTAYLGLISGFQAVGDDTGMNEALSDLSKILKGC